MTTLHKYDIIPVLSKYCTDTPKKIKNWRAVQNLQTIIGGNTMHNDEKILKEGSKAFNLMTQLKKHASVCFKEGDFKYEAVMSSISALETIFKPYVLELEKLQEERRQKKLKLKQICAEEGHIGEWKEVHYEIHDWIGDLSDRQYVPIPKVKWVRTCARCGKRMESITEPKEATILRKKRKIEKLEEEIKKMKS